MTDLLHNIDIRSLINHRLGYSQSALARFSLPRVVPALRLMDNHPAWGYRPYCPIGYLSLAHKYSRYPPAGYCNI